MRTTSSLLFRYYMYIMHSTTNIGEYNPLHTLSVLLVSSTAQAMTLIDYVDRSLDLSWSESVPNIARRYGFCNK